MYDPRVLVRIQRGKEQDAADYIELLEARRDFIRRMAAITAPYRCAGDADDADHRAAHRRSRRRTMPTATPTRRCCAIRRWPTSWTAARFRSRATRWRCAGRADADRRARRRPQAAGHGGRDRASGVARGAPNSRLFGLLPATSRHAKARFGVPKRASRVFPTALARRACVSGLRRPQWPAAALAADTIASEVLITAWMLRA